MLMMSLSSGRLLLETDSILRILRVHSDIEIPVVFFILLRWGLQEPTS